MAQYIVTGWVEGYGSSQDIVSHVSFAGTIVSIILAVLAIVYSYYQTFAQERDSATLSTQLQAMGRVVEDIRSSRRDLSLEVDRFAELGAKIDRSIEVTEDARSAVQQVSSEIKELKARDAAPVSQPGPTEKLDRKALAATLVNRATHLQLTVFYAVYFAVRDRLSTTEARDRIIRPAYLRKDLPTLVEWVDGIWTGSFQSLVALSLVRVERTKKESGFDTRFDWIDENFQATLLDAVANTPEDKDEPFLTFQSVKEAAEGKPRS